MNEREKSVSQILQDIYQQEGTKYSFIRDFIKGLFDNYDFSLESSDIEEFVLKMGEIIAKPNKEYLLG